MAIIPESGNPVVDATVIVVASAFAKLTDNVVD
jgi:hypothetical protein